MNDPRLEKLMLELHSLVCNEESYVRKNGQNKFYRKITSRKRVTFEYYFEEYLGILPDEERYSGSKRERQDQKAQRRSKTARHITNQMTIDFPESAEIVKNMKNDSEWFRNQFIETVCRVIGAMINEYGANRSLFQMQANFNCN